jgi:hypothetical protein
MKGLHDGASDGTYLVCIGHRALSPGRRLAHAADSKGLIISLIEPGRYAAMLAGGSGVNRISLPSEVLFSHACRSQALGGLEQKRGFWAKVIWPFSDGHLHKKCNRLLDNHSGLILGTQMNKVALLWRLR